MSMTEPLHERDTIGPYDVRAGGYARNRPTYPPEAIDAILDGLGDPASLRAADIGAGTGISARLLADRGVRVIAIEPNAAMRAAARPHPNVQWRDAAADRTGLPDASLDLVLCAQAYHWFEPKAACAEFARILEPAGRLALIWNDGDESEPLVKGYYDLIRAVSPQGPSSHKGEARNPVVRPPFGRLSCRSFRHAQRFDVQGLIGRAMSASYVPNSGPAADRIVAGLKQLHAQFADADGLVTFEYDALVYLAHRER